MTGSREVMLHAIRAALAPGAPHAEPPRDYRLTLDLDPPALGALFTERLLDYRAEVVTCAGGDEAIARTLSELLRSRQLSPVIAPSVVLERWLAELAAGEQVRVVADDPGVSAADLDGVAAVVTGCSVAIAETGVVILDGDPWCGRRAISLVPDVHLCVVRVDQVVALPPEAIARLDPTSPQTWIAGPSATSDIELNRVEGVHGPRNLVVVLAG